MSSISAELRMDPSCVLEKQTNDLEDDERY
jgi:hypothetical protein